MTNKNLFDKLKTKIVLVLAVLFALCSSMFFLTACNNESTSSTKPSFSYTDTDDCEIANPNFVNDTANKKNDAYPIISASSWTKSYHQSAYSSNVDSGVIDVSEELWELLSADMKSDADLINALVTANRDDITQKLRDEKGDQELNVTTELIKNYIKEHFNDVYFANPGTHSNAKENKMYMLNNYTQSTIYRGVGTAQTVTSASTVTVEAGTIGHLSLWIKTANIAHLEADPDNYGANIRLTNTINGETQSEFRISSIKANEWTKYEIYIKADEEFDSTFVLSFGLGYGSGSSTSAEYYTQGTAFFDNIEYEVVDSLEGLSFNDSNTKYLEFANETAKEFIAKDATSFLYDMSFDYPSDLFNSISSNHFQGLNSSDDYFTYSNITNSNGKKISSKDIYSNGTIQTNKTENGFSVKLNKAAASAKLESSEFVVDSGEYAILTFKVTNELNVRNNTDITVDVYDVLGSNTVKRPAILKITETDNSSVSYTVTVSNNFAEVDNRSFYIVFCIGPNDVSSVSYSDELASGEVIISDIKVTKGLTDSDEESEIDTYLSFASKSSSASLSLYAGYSQDYEKVEETVSSFNLTTKPSDFGTIVNYPANAKGYEGITSNHIYLVEDKNNDADKKVNTRSGNQGKNVSYAGLINTTWLDSYKLNTGLDIEKELGTLEDEIQPLMIYNNDKDSYGFISQKYSVSSGESALVSVKVRVTGQATAYIYLVDVSKVQKNILKFDNFSTNVEASKVGQNTKGDSNTADLSMAIKIDGETLTDNGEEWVTVSFYLATGSTAKDFRLEIWNGSRDGKEKSQGYVFFNDISVNTSSAFTESVSWSASIFEDSSSPLYGIDVKDDNVKELLAYQRTLTDTEKSFNNEYPDSAVKYNINYVWAKTDTMIYAVMNTLDPIETDPYDSIEEEEETSNCNAQTDSSTFWLNFSTILLAVCLVVAIIMLFTKTLVRKHKANKSDAKSHYTVTSRIKNNKNAKTETKNDVQQETSDSEDLEDVENEEILEEPEEEIPSKEKNLDDYVYGDVQNFGEESENSSDDKE